MIANAVYHIGAMIREKASGRTVCNRRGISNDSPGVQLTMRRY